MRRNSWQMLGRGGTGAPALYPSGSPPLAPVSPFFCHHILMLILASKGETTWSQSLSLLNDCATSSRPYNGLAEAGSDLLGGCLQIERTAVFLTLSQGRWRHPLTEPLPRLIGPVARFRESAWMVPDEGKVGECFGQVIVLGKQRKAE